MEKEHVMNWKAFKNNLLENTGLYLQFQYAEGTLVDAGYHITEIKQAPITSVDCGGVMNKWTEIIVQLWVPDAEPAQYPMKADKALSIINIVEKMMPLDEEATVKIEFGNSQFDTRQMFPTEMIAEGNSLTIDLRADEVQCKAQTRGGSCGTTDKGEECCAPVTKKPIVKLINLAAPAEACCTPGSGCC